MPHTRYFALPASLATFATVLILLAFDVAPALAQTPTISSSCAGKSHTSIFLEGSIIPSNLQTHWSFAYSTTEGGPWTPVPGGSGTISQVEAEEIEEEGQPFSATVEAELHGLTPEVNYHVLLTATNSSGKVEVEAQESGLGAVCETVPLHTTLQIIQVSNVTATSAHVLGQVNPNQNNVEIHWRYEIATAETGPWSPAPGAEGTITKAEAEAAPPGGPYPRVAADLIALDPATTYYIRLFAEDEPEYPEGSGEDVHKEATSTLKRFSTSGPPVVSTFATHAIHGEDIRVLGFLTPNNSGPNEVQSVTIEGAPAAGTFTLAPPNQSNAATGTGKLTAGSPTISHVLTSTGVFASGEPITGTGIPLGATIIGIKHADGSNHFEESLILSQPATVSGATVALTAALPPIPFDATASELRGALEKLSGIGASNVSVTGSDGGPYIVEFTGEKASSNQPQLVADASAFTPSGSVTVASVRDGFFYETKYHFEYVSQKAFGEGGGWVAATPTPEQHVEDTQTHVVGADLPELEPGESYRYRIVATNTTPGNPVVDGEEQAFIVPNPTVEPQPRCENESFRTGLSAHLPNCRAYEQITPIDKEGAQELFHYGPTSEGSGALASEDGDHLVIGSPETKWGAGPGAGQSPYFFTRAASGWQMTPASPQPQTGVNRIVTQVLLDPNLTSFGFASYWKTSPFSESLNDEFKAGPPGGPYTTVASVPRSQVPNGGGWVAASEDFSKLILEVEDHALLGPPTATVSGPDLYEYSDGQLRQVNVGAGACGARIVKGQAEPNHGGGGGASRHAVSADGHRVFFEAVPSSDCSAPTHLYMRVGGDTDHAETIDIGPYVFAAANRNGTKLLLEKQIGQTREFFLYDTESAIATPIFAGTPGSEVAVSEGFTAIYFTSTEQFESTEAPPVFGFLVFNLYRYDIPNETLHFLVQAHIGQVNGHGGPSPDGRYYYFAAESVFGLPAGTSASNDAQVYRYDNTAAAVQCLSCASPFDPEPALSANYAGFGLSAGVFGNSAQGMPGATPFSANGDYAFFDTRAALVPQDVDGEVTGREYEAHSPSSDVYEWRRDGLDGCARLQGCLSLISSGKGGFKVMLLGTSHQGRDVYFSDFSQLLPQDNDSAGDVYDARIGGGFAEPSPPAECEGDACSTPVPAPNDPTPSSSTFHGAGNEHPKGPGKHKHHKKRHKAKRKRHHKQAGVNHRGAK